LEQFLYTVGIMADTHGIIPNRVIELFEHVDHIIHAGDIGTEDILFTLETLAPVTAVYGNVDPFPLRRRLKERREWTLYGFHMVVTHFPNPNASIVEPGIQISGHTHKPFIRKEGESLYINPGSTTYPRGLIDPSVARVTITAPGRAKAEIIYF